MEMEKFYEAPEVELLEVEVERGYVESSSTIPGEDVEFGGRG